MARPASKRLAAASALLAGLVVAATAAASSTGEARPASAAAEVRAAERALIRAVVAGDAATAGSLLAPEFQLVDVTGTAESRKAYLATIGGGVDFVSVTPVSPISVRVYGRSAVARFREAFVVSARGTRLQHRGWSTDVLEQRHGRWLFVWSQTTATPNDPGLFIQSLQPRA